ncbi:RNA polymerase II C-terminal domain phosphatase-like 4 isoform X1 [Lotus japonicus]|uniref:RNA polymerase II C-terminal domain phosphatase-like 4 isoform X1 n=1 Tax=Lotus japonicus TaxID=34305 RepID=UPI0025863C31|nr:RNA polymerase II C-terminal domain phosphatase-like 4 isoform X1 [Lotus japonicus]
MKKTHRKPFQIFIQSPHLQQLRHESVTADQTLADLKRSLFPASHHLSSFYFTLHGKPLPEETPLLTLRIAPLSTLVLQPRLRGGVANDAESRDGYLDIYTEKTPDSVDFNKQRLSKSMNCTLSKVPLREPCVIDKLGNVFNKEALEGALLGKNLPEKFWHIQDLKDLITIWLSSIPGDEDGARFQCPVSGLEFNGMNSFFALRNCGHVLSAKALKEVNSSSCLVCHEGFAEFDKVLINGSEGEGEVVVLREKTRMNPSYQSIDVKNTDASSSSSSSDKEAENIDEAESGSTKRRKVETEETEGSTLEGIMGPELVAQASVGNGCIHPYSFRGMCMDCEQDLDEKYGIPFEYIHEGLRLHDVEISRVRNEETKHFLCHKKLYLVLDLDQTLLNSVRFDRLSSKELYLLTHTDSLGDSLFKSDTDMMTKLRPFVRTFLKEASKYFEMYIYTMGNRSYAQKMAKLLDPQAEYFKRKVISRDDNTQKHQKGLDVVLGQESAVLILDDTKKVWTKHEDNLILIERYHFFARSRRQFGLNFESLAELKTDENETDGALKRILVLLKLVHYIFFYVLKEDLIDRDVRKVLSSLRTFK